jgi:hypothetical protein
MRAPRGRSSVHGDYGLLESHHHDRAGSLCGFRGKAGTIPGSSRSAFQNEAGHDSGVNPVTDSDFKAVTLSHLSEP